MGMPGVNDVLAEPTTQHNIIGSGTSFDAVFLAAKKNALDFLKSQGISVDEEFLAKLSIDLACPKERSPPGFLGLIYLTPRLWQYLHAGRGKDGLTPTVYIASRLVEYLSQHLPNDIASDYFTAFLIHEISHLLGFSHEVASLLHRNYLGSRFHHAAKLEELLFKLTAEYSQKASVGYIPDQVPIVDIQNFFKANPDECQQLVVIFDRQEKGSVRLL
jgi:hypothetical protein